EALASFKRIADGYPSRPQSCAEAMLWRSDVYEEKGDLDKARSECQALLDRYSGEPAMKDRCREAQYRLPCLFKAAGRLQEALDGFAKIIPDPDPQDSLAASALLKRAEIFRDMSEPDKALNELKSLVEKYPRHKNTCVRAKFLMARCLKSTSDLTGARKILRELSADSTVQGSSGLLRDLVALQLEIGDESGGRAAIRQYTSNLSKSSDAAKVDFAQLELAYHIKHDLQQAGLVAATCIKRYPNDPRVADALFIRGEFLMSRGDTAEGLKVFDALITTYGDKPGNEYNCAYAKIHKASCLLPTDPTAAREILNDLTKDPAIKRHANLLHHLFALQRQIGDETWRATARDYIAAMSNAGAAPGAFAKLEIAYYFENNIKEATELSAEFLEKYPAHDLAPEAAFIRARCMLSAGDEAGALSSFDALAARYESIPGSRIYTNTALQDAADLLAKSGRMREAEKRLYRISTVSPAETILKYIAIGRMYRRAGSWKAAARAFARGAATKCAPLDMIGEALYNAGDCYRQLGDPDSAAVYFQDLMDHAPNSSWAREARGVVHLWSIGAP
ncbi:MAG: tetratricopeptide repeat protein, partial [Armatimonadota bacterium]|nr:tetratricopeptide repeat protein [Armatimonadota bacterium]